MTDHEHPAEHPPHDVGELANQLHAEQHGESKGVLDNPDHPLQKMLTSKYATAFSVGWKTVAAVGGAYLLGASVPVIAAAGATAAAMAYPLKKTGDYLLKEGYIGSVYRGIRDLVVKGGKYLFNDLPKGIYESTAKKVFDITDKLTGGASAHHGEHQAATPHHAEPAPHHT